MALLMGTIIPEPLNLLLTCLGKVYCRWFYVRRRLGIPTALTNDANAAAVGEMTYGAARGMKDFIMITLGTGVGSGIVINGQVVYGHDGLQANSSRDCSS